MKYWRRKQYLDAAMEDQPQRNKAPLALIVAVFIAPLLIVSGCIAAQPLIPQLVQPFSTVVVPALIHPVTIEPSQALTSTQSTLLPASAEAVTIENFSFAPSVLTVTVGTSVTWTNEDDMPHTVKSVDGLFSSAGLDTGDSFTYQFTQPGVYRYYCAIHPMMTATVVVR